MAITCGFYNSKPGARRKYSARQMSRLFKGIIEDGVFPNVGNSLAIKAATGFTITVGTGRCWFNDSWTENDALEPLTVEPAELLLKRIDAVVVEVNSTVPIQDNTIKIVKGIPSSAPVKPTMVTGEMVNQHPLAYIMVNPGATEITQANIETAIGTAECPYVTGPLKSISADALLAQWASEWEIWLSENTSEFGEFMFSNRGAFDTWFDAMKDQLTTDAAGNLQMQINRLYMGAKASIVTNYLALRDSIREMKIAGATKVEGTGDVSPTNIRPISGVGLYDKKIVFDGSADEGWAYISQGRAIIAVSDITIPTSPAVVGAVFCDNYAPGTWNQVYKGTPVIGVSSSRDVGIGLSGTDINTLERWRAHLSAHPLTIYYQSTTYSTATQVYIGFSVTDANGYHGYAFGPMAPLFEGDVLTWSGGITAEVLRKSAQLILDGTENFSMFAPSSPATFQVFRVTSSQLPVKPVQSTCSHFKAGVTAWNTMTNLQEVVGGTAVAIRYDEITDVAAFKSYLATQKSAGTPVKFVYQREAPITETVPISEPIVNAEGLLNVTAEGTFEISFYGASSLKEMNQALEHIKQANPHSGSAPTVHVSTDPAKYGPGSGTNYGHVALSDDPTRADWDTTKAIAATPKAVKAVRDIAVTAQASANTAQGAADAKMPIAGGTFSGAVRTQAYVDGSINNERIMNTLVRTAAGANVPTLMILMYRK